MLKPRSSLCIAFAALALALVGCSSQPVVEVEPDPRPSRAVTDSVLVFENNPDLEDSVQLERVVVDPRSTPLRVQFEVVNTSKSDYDFMYKVRWFDEAAISVPDPNEVWRKQSIQGKERLSLTVTAPTPRAIDYRLVLREWDR